METAIYVPVGVKKQTIPTNERLEFFLIDEIPFSDGYGDHWNIRKEMEKKLTAGLQPFIERANTEGKKLSIALFIEWEDEARAVITAINVLSQLPEDIATKIKQIEVFCGYYPDGRGSYILEFLYKPGQIEEGQIAHGG